MSCREINFDGLIGPTHNYAGLSLGNVASAGNAGAVARPRAAALQGLAKMRRLMDLGAPQGFLPPPLRPAIAILRQIGYRGSDGEVLRMAADADIPLFRAVCSASSMWTANAATVIAAADSGDGRVHLVGANLATMLHRAIEAEETCRTLRTVFGEGRHFVVHDPLPLGQHFSDEGAANHMRLTAAHGAPGLNVFVHGEERGGRFPERQAERASRAVARLADLPAERAIFVRQGAAAIQAGAFHNDVVAVANETVLLAHADAFADREHLLDAVRARIPGAEIAEVAGITLAAAVATYLFNSQIVTLPSGGMALILPTEVRDNAKVWQALDRTLGIVRSIAQVVVVDVRESMRNGGGPACLRLRVPVSAAAEASIHPGFLLSPARWDRLARLVEAHWPETIAPADLLDPAMWDAAQAGHQAIEAFIRQAA